MAKRKAESGRGRKHKDDRPARLRAGGWRRLIPNSGLEVWLYDDDNRRAIRAAAGADEGSGGMPGNFGELTRQGLVVGYDLQQDDTLDVEVHVGEPLTVDEAAAAPWLAPQQAWLRLPSGRLCVESNDASRIGPEKPTARGAAIDLAAGDYRLTLYRIDSEALHRLSLEWDGPQEVIVLTPGGDASDAASDLLPFQPRRDTDWIGRYAITGRRAEALVWFPDYWDTFIVNLDPAAVAQLGLVPGAYFRTDVAPAGLSLVSAYAATWQDGQRLRPPAGVALDDYGVGALQTLGEWNGAEALYCRRERAKTRVEAEHHDTWLPATIEVLDVEPLPARARREFTPADFAQKTDYYDEYFLAAVLGDLLPGADDADDFPLDLALGKLDKALAKLGYAMQGDIEWQDELDGEPQEFCCRVYGAKDAVTVLVLAQPGLFDVLFVSELAPAGWIVTGLADDFERLVRHARAHGAANTDMTVQCLDDTPRVIEAAHRKALRAAAAAPVAGPLDHAARTAFLERFLASAFG